MKTIIRFAAIDKVTLGATEIYGVGETELEAMQRASKILAIDVNDEGDWQDYKVVRCEVSL